MKKNGSVKYMVCLLLAMVLVITGCAKTEEKTERTYQATEEDLSYALPKIGEATIIEAKMQAGAKGTITVATVGSPNTEILQEAGRILGEKGYLLKIESCEDYFAPNRMVEEGKADCNFYQHEAFLERYNIENGTTLAMFAKVYYEPMAIYSSQLDGLTRVEKGAKVLVPDNPTALAQSLWLLQAEGLLTLMEDADLRAVVDDISENPLDLQLVPVEEEEILANMAEAELVICHTGYGLKAGKDMNDSVLAVEKKESPAAGALSQAIVVKEYPNDKAEILTEVLMSKEMQEFMQKRYQGTVYMMDGKLSDIRVTMIEEENEENGELSQEEKIEE